MGKLLVLLIAVLVVFILWKGFRRAADSDGRGGGASDGERMVDCSQCGLHLPISEALQSQGRYFCSEEHRRLFSR